MGQSRPIAVSGLFFLSPSFVISYWELSLDPSPIPPAITATTSKALLKVVFDVVFKVILDFIFKTILSVIFIATFMTMFFTILTTMMSTMLSAALTATMTTAMDATCLVTCFITYHITSFVMLLAIFRTTFPALFPALLPDPFAPGRKVSAKIRRACNGTARLRAGRTNARLGREILDPKQARSANGEGGAGRGRLEHLEELFRRDSGLPQDTSQRPDGNHAMRRDNTANRALERRLPHDDVASALTHPDKPKPLQRLDRLLT